MDESPKVGHWLDGNCLANLIRAASSAVNKHVPREHKKPCGSIEEKKGLAEHAA